MWTTENRGRYDRSRLRYPSDLTDEEWKHVEPLIPPGKRGGGKRTVAMREVVNGLMYILSTGCQWAAISEGPSAQEHGRMIISTCGAGTARSIASMKRSTRSVASKPRVRPVRPPPSLTARASGALKKGASRSAGLRRWQEDQGQETSHPRPTRKACSCTPSCTPPTFRTATAARC